VRPEAVGDGAKLGLLREEESERGTQECWSGPVGETRSVEGNMGHARRNWQATQRILACRGRELVGWQVEVRKYLGCYRDDPLSCYASCLDQPMHGLPTASGWHGPDHSRVMSDQNGRASCQLECPVIATLMDLHLQLHGAPLEDPS
jgi:hypothetical protein